MNCKAFVIASKLFVAVFVAMLTFFASSVVAQSNGDGTVYELEFELVRDGKVIIKPKMTVLPGKPAQIRIGDRNAKDGNMRLQVTVSPDKTRNRVDVNRIDLTILEQVDGAWVVVAEPSMSAINGKSAAMEFPGQFGRYVIRGTATSVQDAKEAAKKVSQCEVLDAPTASASSMCPHCPALPCDQCPNCCESPCADGSGQTMSCCGATSCCACGTCCEPPL